MEQQNGFNDAVKIMETYNFHKPIKVSIIYEDHNEEPMFFNSHTGDFALINKVAEILDSIKKGLVHFCYIIPRSKNEKRKGRMKAHWLRVKHKLFNECLATSKEFLLQHGVTDQYIKDILSNIEQISKLPITYDIISNIRECLLQWIQLKQFEMTYSLSHQNEFHPSEGTVHSYSHLSSENRTRNMYTTNISSYGPPGNQLTLNVDPEFLPEHRNVHNAINSTIPASSSLQGNNTGTYHIPHSNYSNIGVNNQHDNQLNIPSAPMRYNTEYYNHAPINSPQSVCYNGKQFNRHNIMSTQNNQMYSDGTIARNSISRDSGFASPVTSEYNFDNVQNTSF